MAWILETASGKFIDNFASKSEADKARRNIGIIGCKVRQGKVPVTRLLATQVGGVPPHFQSVENFIEYLEEDERTTYHPIELNKLVAGTHLSRDAIVARLRAKNIIPVVAGKQPPRAAPKPPPAPTGWKKPLAKDDSERTRAKRLARTKAAQKIPLSKLTGDVINRPIASLNQTQQARKKAFVEALTGHHLEIQLRVQDYNEAVDDFIRTLTERSNAITGAIDEYNEVVGAASDFVTEIRDSAQEYFDEKTEKWQGSDAFQEWLNALDALPDLVEIDEDDLNIPDPDAIEDEYKIDAEVEDEENAAVIADIPDGPS
jgi:hypothetical protein